MADAYQFIDSTGVIVADPSDIKTTVQNEWKEALGQDLVLDDDTPQGQLIDGETLARSNVVRNNAQIANQINPSQSGGVFLDAMCAWLRIERLKATRTVVNDCDVGGVPNTFIPAGSRARTKAGDIVQTVSDVTLSAAGTGVVGCRAEEYGPIVIPANSLDRPVDTVLGWETISNSQAGQTGRLQQSDASLRQSREERLARNTISAVEAIISGLYDIEGVHSLQFRENTSNQTVTIDGITLKPHSIWACVYGGADADIAATLLREKTDGAGYNGDVEVGVLENASGQTYKVQFDRPDEVPIKVRITASQSQATSIMESSIKSAVMQYASGEMDGQKGLATGVPVSPFEIGGAVNIVYPGFFVRKVEVARLNGDYQAFELAMSLREVPTLDAANITVVSA